MSAIEVLVSLVIFSIVATGLGAAMVQANNWLSSAKVESGANNIAQGELDSIKRRAYNEVGIVGGNPSGSLAASEVKTVGVNRYTITRAIVYVDDQVTAGAHSEANYKKVTITVDPPGRGKTVTQTSIVAPPSFESIDGKAIVGPTIVDAADPSITIPEVSVNLTLTGGGGFNRTDKTDVAGRASFPSLAPTGGGQQYKLALTKLGYKVKAGETLTQSLTTGQIWRPTIKMERDAGAKAVLVDAGGQPFARPAKATLTLPDGTKRSQPTTTGATTFTGFGASTASFLMSAESDDGCASATSVSSAVPAPGDANNTHVFTLTMTAAPSMTITVEDTTGKPIGGAAVTVDTTSYVASPTGDVQVCLDAGPHSITADAVGYGPTPASLTTTATSGTVTLRLAPGSQTCAVTIRGVAGTEGKGVEVFADGYYATPMKGPTHQIIGSIDPNDRSFTATGLIVGQDYYARVKDASGNWTASTSQVLRCSTAGQNVDLTSPPVAP